MELPATEEPCAHFFPDLRTNTLSRHSRRRCLVVQITVRSSPRGTEDARAGEGNRTLTASLEGWGSTIELRPHSRPHPALFTAPKDPSQVQPSQVKLRGTHEQNCSGCGDRLLQPWVSAAGWQSTVEPQQSPVGEAGFEPAKAEPPDLQSGPFGHSGIPPLNLSTQLSDSRLSTSHLNPQPNWP